MKDFMSDTSKTREKHLDFATKHRSLCTFSPKVRLKRIMIQRNTGANLLCLFRIYSIFAFKFENYNDTRVLPL